MKKNLEINECYILQIPIAYISNNKNDIVNIENDKTNTIELADNYLTFEKFTNLFYGNNYHYFEINSQYKGTEEFLINKKIKNYNTSLIKKNVKLSIIDIMSEKYISKNKTKIPNHKYINFIKDVTNYSSLLDFKFYNQRLTLEDVSIIYQQQYKKNKKQFFRFTITVNYYSVDLEENINIISSFLTKIPNRFKFGKINDSDDEEEEEEKEEEEEEEEEKEKEEKELELEKKNEREKKNINNIIDEHKVKNTKNKEKTNKFVSPKKQLVENLVYSNYRNNNYDNIDFIENSSNYEKKYTDYNNDSEVESEVESVIDSVIDSLIESDIDFNSLVSEDNIEI